MNFEGDILRDDLGAALLAQGVIDAATLDRGRRAQSRTHERIDVILTRLGLVSDADMARAVAQFLRLPLLGPQDFPTEPVLGDQLSASFVKTNKILPLDDREDGLTIAMADPFNLEAVEAIAYLIERDVRRCVVTLADFEKAVEQIYDRPQDELSAVAEDGASSDDNSDDDVERLRDIASEAPVIRLVNKVIANAVEQHASDIHIEPLEDSICVRYRIDGVMQDVQTLPLNMRAATTSRVKIMAKLNIAERRLPQDGRIKVTVRGKDVDLRISTTPTLYGESVVMRILDRSHVELDFKALGFDGKAETVFRGLLQQPNGIVLVTGPTGSGKTTTLYTALKELNDPSQKLFTVEDPIEYYLPRVNQLQVQPGIGLDFAHALRSILRQDPDIIMIGEIRDLETAQIAIQSSLTGHLVFSTLHTNDAAASLTRLLDMGVEDYLLASTISGILAQRLVRRLCPHCSRPHKSGPQLIRKFAAFVDGRGRKAAPDLREPAGCTECQNVGYAGRTCIVELMIMDDDLRGLLLASASEKEIQAAAISNGMKTMFEDGLEKALAGETTIEEVLRVTRMS